MPNGNVVTQHGYIAQILSDLGLSDCNPAVVLLSKNIPLTLDMANPPVDPHEYRCIIGKLNFLLQTRPNITYALNTQLSRFSSCPQVLHLNAVKYLLRYLKGTLDFGLLYWREEESCLTGFSHSNWAGNRDDRKSTSSYLFLLGSTPITWRSQKQPCIALSSTKAEYVALSSCAKEGIWLCRILQPYEIPPASTYSLKAK